MQALFSVARNKQPAVIFFDEIDALLSTRKDNEHDASRRLKTEFLTQVDGASTNSEDRLLISKLTKLFSLFYSLMIVAHNNSGRYEYTMGYRRGSLAAFSKENLCSITRQ